MVEETEEKHENPHPGLSNSRDLNRGCSKYEVICHYRTRKMWRVNDNVCFIHLTVLDL